MSRDLELHIAWASLGGPMHPHNEDSALALPAVGRVRAGRALAVVADGVGGSSDGRRASRMTVEELSAAFDQALSGRDDLERELERINAAVHAEGRHYPRGIASTVVAALFAGPDLHLAWAGDSRAYRVRGGALELLTRDHLYGGHELSLLTRAVGGVEALEAEHHHERPAAGDRYLLLSDGVWAYLPEDALHRLAAPDADPGTAANSLVERALGGGGTDDATALVVDVAAVPDGGA